MSDTEGLTFGQAIVAAKSGSKVARTGWNGTGMFAYVVPTAVCNTYAAEDEIFGVKLDFTVREHWRIKTAQGDVATWAPSSSDSLANDWCILN